MVKAAPASVRIFMKRAKLSFTNAPLKSCSVGAGWPAIRSAAPASTRIETMLMVKAAPRR